MDESNVKIHPVVDGWNFLILHKVFKISVLCQKYPLWLLGCSIEGSDVCDRTIGN